MAPPVYRCEFAGDLIRWSGEGAWVFVMVPAEHAPTATLGWGRTPVRAVVDGKAWDTSVWREKTGRTLLAVPKKVRGAKDDGDRVNVRLEYSVIYRP